MEKSFHPAAAVTLTTLDKRTDNYPNPQPLPLIKTGEGEQILP